LYQSVQLFLFVFDYFYKMFVCYLQNYILVKLFVSYLHNYILVKLFVSSLQMLNQKYIPHYIINCRVLKVNYYITIISQLKENYYITITSLLTQSSMFLPALSICKRSCIVAIEKPNVLHEVSLQSVRRGLVMNFGVRINQLRNFWHISIRRNRWV
jgi:hypothetical protein